MTSSELDVPVRKSITVRAGVAEAFELFTQGIDTWWPRTHHIGSSPMKRAVIECRRGGRCYSEQVDGTECDWGTVLVWEPPHRLVMAWQITGEWQYEPDIDKSSEVEIRFTEAPDGRTRVDLEHRAFSRMPVGGLAMRTMVDQPDGWGGVLEHFANRAAARAGAA
ncbi:MAG: SRPBCC domain-containing protein [Gemmatimonadaceae bacterium]|nr:SRPBCC domain-containing protein [Gemmatimonadaceae bacterium]